jgi:hypothetical protein
MRADTGAWLQAIADLEDRMQDLQQGCEGLHVHPGNGVVYRWQGRAARRFWRRKRPLSAYLDTHAEQPGGPRDEKR